MQLELFDSANETLKEDLFKAYFDCRKNKRNSLSALNFEINYEA